MKFGLLYVVNKFRFVRVYKTHFPESLLPGSWRIRLKKIVLHEMYSPILSTFYKTQ